MSKRANQGIPYRAAHRGPLALPSLPLGQVSECNKPSVSVLISYFLFFIITIASPACRLNPNSSKIIPIESPIAAPTSPRPIILDDLSANDRLADLQSYRANLIMEFEGIRNGQPASGRLELLTEVTREPAVLHRYLKVDTTIPNPEIISSTVEFYRVLDKVYVKKGDEGRWFTFIDGSVSPDTLGFFALDRLIILPPTVSQPSQPELFDDLKVQHFTFTESDLTEPNIIFEKAEGDLWLAEPGNYLAQYIISATLRIVIPDPKAHIFDQGHFSLRYTLSDVNANFDIIPPQAVLTKSEPLGTLPRLPDAEIVSVFPTFIEYTSSITPVNAALFYRDELTTQGWTEDNAEIFNEKARLTFSKEGQILIIVINPHEDRQRIKVMLDLRMQP
jgi:hypothetical protein